MHSIPIDQRRGISLMEVLMSIGVLVIGLLGVSALIPVAGHQAEEGIRNERLAAVGKRAFREIRIQGLLKQNNWMELGGPRGVGPFGGGPATPNAPFRSTFPIANSVYHQPRTLCLDPRVVDCVGADPQTNLRIFADASKLGISTGARYVPFIVPRSLPTDPAFVYAEDVTRLIQPKNPFFDEMSVRQDDLTFTVKRNSRNPPASQWLHDSAGYPMKRSGTGRFSWMAMLTPEHPQATLSNTYTGRYVVSVAVFENRPVVGSGRVPAPTDFRRFFVASSDGYGGGTTVLRDVLPNQLDKRYLNNIKRGSWLLMVGHMPARTPDCPQNLPSNYSIIDYQWYRIRSVDWGDHQTPPAFDLEGPDWRIPPNPTGQNVAIYFPVFHNRNTNVQSLLPWNIAAVYTKTMAQEF